MPKPFVRRLRLGRPHQHEPRRRRHGRQPASQAATASERRRATAATRELAYQFTAGVLAPRAARSPPSLCPTVNSYKRLLPGGLHERDLVGAGLPGLRAQQPHADVPAAHEPALPGAAHRRQRLQLLPRDGARARRRPGRASAPARPGRPGQRRHLHGRRRGARRGAGSHRLPRNLGEALDAFERRLAGQETFGDEFHATFVAYKRAEWDEYNTVVGEWEREQYLHSVVMEPTTSDDAEPSSANQEAFARLTSADPVLVDIRPARRGRPGHDRRRRSSPRAPRCAWERVHGGQRRAMIYGAVYEGLAADRRKPTRQARRRRASGSAPATTTAASGRWPASTPPRCRSSWWRTRRYGNRGFCNFYEGESRRRLNYGVYDDEVAARPATSSSTALAPVLRDAVLRRSGGIPLKPMIRRALHMGDELHSRNTAGDPAASPASCSARMLLELAGDGWRRRGAATTLAFLRRERLLLPAPVDGGGEGDGRRRRTASPARAWSPR